MKEVCIVSMSRTPFGSFGGSLSGFSACKLGSIAVKSALSKINLDKKHIQELYFGNVISAGLGQAPATQVAVGANLGYDIPCTLINKVCASGMKAVMLGAQSIMAGQSDVVLAGGMESMSNAPFYLSRARFGYKYGNGELLDGLYHDGLMDAYNRCAMGVCSDMTATRLKISREEQDEYAISSYRRAAAAWEEGKFENEIMPVEVKVKKSIKIVAEDEEYTRVDFEKIPTLKPIFGEKGTTTAANASTLNDGAAALVLMSREKASDLNLTPLAKVRGFADAAQESTQFTTTPSLAIPKALKAAGVEFKDVDYYEINEAFSSVALANAKEMNLDLDTINVNGGAVALGHPIGASGARITMALISVLQQRNASIGVAGICNGGGGASAIVLEKV